MGSAHPTRNAFYFIAGVISLSIQIVQIRSGTAYHFGWQGDKGNYDAAWIRLIALMALINSP
jgi:hypothetical protein